MINLVVKIITGLLFVYSCSAFPELALRIPNGDRIPNPCNREQTCPGIGHWNMAGGRGGLNPFGIDLYAANFSWATVCPMDSDGDGFTNGEELGDPYCKWEPFKNMQPDIVNRNGLSHPGICEPIDAPTCEQANALLNLDACKNACPSSSSNPGNLDHPPSSNFGIQTPALLQLNPNNLQHVVIYVNPPAASATRSAIFPVNLALCAEGAEPHKRPTSWSDAVQCDSENPCPSGFGCVVGPAEFSALAVCCPLTPPPTAAPVNCPQKPQCNQKPECLQRPNCNPPTTPQPPPPPACPPIPQCNQAKECPRRPHCDSVTSTPRPSCPCGQPLATTTPLCKVTCSPSCQVQCQPKRPVCMTCPPPTTTPASSSLFAILVAPDPNPPPAPNVVIVGDPAQIVQSSIEWCFREPATGPCQNMVVAYYYQPDIGRCAPFAYGGCVALPNGLTAQRGNFNTPQECENICSVLYDKS